MASTRNKNTPGDYKQEQFINQSIDNYSTYVSFVEAPTNNLAGDGLLMGRVPRSQICNNYTDIETQLLGIGSTNLVNPKMFAEPDLNSLKSLNIFEKPKVILPEPLALESGHRKMYLS
jgi:hypothetical protein